MAKKCRRSQCGTGNIVLSGKFLGDIMYYQSTATQLAFLRKDEKGKRVLRVGSLVPF